VDRRPPRDAVEWWLPVAQALDISHTTWIEQYNQKIVAIKKISNVWELRMFFIRQHKNSSSYVHLTIPYAYSEVP